MSNDIKQIPIDFFQRNQILVISESPLTLGICSTSNMEALEDIRLITKTSFEVFGTINSFYRGTTRLDAFATSLSDTIISVASITGPSVVPY